MKKSDIESGVDQIRNQQQEVVEKQENIHQQLILLYKNLETLDNTYDINDLINIDSDKICVFTWGNHKITTDFFDPVKLRSILLIEFQKLNESRINKLIDDLRKDQDFENPKIKRIVDSLVKMKEKANSYFNVNLASLLLKKMTTQQVAQQAVARAGIQPPDDCVRALTGEVHGRTYSQSWIAEDLKEPLEALSYFVTNSVHLKLIIDALVTMRSVSLYTTTRAKKDDYDYDKLILELIKAMTIDQLNEIAIEIANEVSIDKVKIDYVINTIMDKIYKPNLKIEEHKNELIQLLLNIDPYCLDKILKLLVNLIEETEYLIKTSINDYYIKYKSTIFNPVRHGEVVLFRYDYNDDVLLTKNFIKENFLDINNKRSGFRVINNKSFNKKIIVTLLEFTQIKSILDNIIDKNISNNLDLDYDFNINESKGFSYLIKFITDSGTLTNCSILVDMINNFITINKFIQLRKFMISIFEKSNILLKINNSYILKLILIKEQFKTIDLNNDLQKKIINIQNIETNFVKNNYDDFKFNINYKDDKFVTNFNKLLDYKNPIINYYNYNNKNNKIGEIYLFLNNHKYYYDNISINNKYFNIIREIIFELHKLLLNKKIDNELNIKNKPNINNTFSLCKILEIIKTELPNLIIIFNKETFSYTNTNSCNYLKIDVDTIINYDGNVEPSFDCLHLNKKYKIIKNNF